MSRICIPSLYLHMLLILACFAISNAVQSDIACLKSIKGSLEDPRNSLSSWDFNYSTEDFICRFAGVDCWSWSYDESGVSVLGLGLRLSGMALRGPFPIGIKNCTSLTGLNLSHNQLTGPIPSNLTDVLPFITSLDLSYNNFSGFEVGFSLSTILTTLFVFFCSPRSISNKLSYLKLKRKIMKKTRHLIPRSSQVLLSDETRSEERNVNSSRSLSFTSSYVFNAQVTAMEEFIRRLSLQELKSFTNNFENKNVIGYGNMGVMYKGVLNDFPLAVKRLHKFESFEKEFLSVIEILGRLQHTNLIPLLGFCYERQNKFLVYKYISNGTVHQWLHSSQIGWTLRLKIAAGVARGLAWLHHNKVLKVAHLKISSKCILLDDNFEPKISSFGNAMKLVKASDTPSSSRNRVVQDLILYKEDVYSFGVLLLELITGREPSTWINSPCGRKFNLIDECLTGKGFDEEIYETLKIAENCIQPDRDGAISML